MHRANGRVLWHFPFLADEGSHRIDLSQDGDVFAVFVADVTDNGCDIHNLTTVPKQHTEMPETANGPAPSNIYTDNDGKVVGAHHQTALAARAPS